MRHQLTAASAAILTCLLGAAPVLADHHEQEGLQVVPVETFTCNYRDGKGPGDLEPVIANWNQWMDSKESDRYFAITLTPNYYGPDSYFDVGWLGSWPTGAAMGSDTDQWVNEGGDSAAEFFSVIECDSHSNFAAVQLREPKGEQSPDTFVLTFADCDVTEGTEFNDLLAALNAWSDYQDEKGYTNGSWMLFPVYGGGGAEFDFKLVDGYDSYADLGVDYDKYGTGGDYEKYGELLGGMLECDDARVYDARVRRRAAGQE